MTRRPHDEPLHDPQHPGDAGPLARRHLRPHRRRLRRADARPAQRIPLHLPGRGAAAHRASSCRRRGSRRARSCARCARLKATLPAELPLTGLRITAVGNDVTVREGGAQWQADSGQLLMDFEVAPVAGQRHLPAAHAAPAPAPPAPADAVDAWFSRGEALEATDRRAAEAAYRQVLALDPDHADAYLNLGALLCEASAATRRSRSTTRRCAASPAKRCCTSTARVALEDQGRPTEALAELRRQPAARARPGRRALQRRPAARAARRRAAARCATSAPTGGSSAAASTLAGGRVARLQAATSASRWS